MHWLVSVANEEVVESRKYVIALVQQVALSFEEPTLKGSELY